MGERRATMTGRRGTIMGDRRGTMNILTWYMTPGIHISLMSRFIHNNDVNELRKFLSNKNALIDDKDNDGSTALMLASEKNRPTCVETLLSFGADANMRDGDDWTALHYAARNGYSDICLMLLDGGARTGYKDIGGFTPLEWAAYRGHVEVVQVLAERNANTSTSSNYKMTPLIWASGRGFTEIVQILVDARAKVNQADTFGTTPLIYAARRGFNRIVTILLEAGAYCEAVGMYGWTALLIATEGEYLETVRQLLHWKQNLNITGLNDCTALHIAIKQNNTDIAYLLIEAGANVNMQDDEGLSPLIHAARIENQEIMEYLLENKAEINAYGLNHKTAMYYAVQHDHIPIAELLLRYGADLELATLDGDTPLMLAVRKRSSAMAQLLMLHNAKVFATNKEGDNVLHMAIRARAKPMVEILLRNPKHGQLLYRYNKKHETPYNIDHTFPTQILEKIYGAKVLHWIDEHEDLWGYELYCSTLADMLSEPLLTLPISVGLYAKWGSGKSYLLHKLRNNMQNFNIEAPSTNFNFTITIGLWIFHTCLFIGSLVGALTKNWWLGLLVGGEISLIVVLLLVFISTIHWYFQFNWTTSLFCYLEGKQKSFHLVYRVMFVHPSSTPNFATKPVRFVLTKQKRLIQTGAEQTLLDMTGSFYTQIEATYGAISSRLYRALQPEPVECKNWKLRKIFFVIPAAVVFQISLLSLNVLICSLITLMDARGKRNQERKTQWQVSLGLVLGTSILLGAIMLSYCLTLVHILHCLCHTHKYALKNSLRLNRSLVRAEGFQQIFSQEAQLMTNMIQCLDSWSMYQTRLVLIVDELDSFEQNKELKILDTIKVTLLAPKRPFIVIFANDPQAVATAVEETNIRMFKECNIRGSDFLRNMVFLPFYLGGLRRKLLKVAIETSTIPRRSRIQLFDDLPEDEGDLTNQMPDPNKSMMTLMTTFSIDEPGEHRGEKERSKKKGIEALNIHRVVREDDYFSDVNPTGMKTILNLLYVQGRLLKAHGIQFNWFNLASWINITQLWPFRSSCLIAYYSLKEMELSNELSLSDLYDMLRSLIPTDKEYTDMDRDYYKFEYFLKHHKALQVFDLKIFLPFTINLDPYFVRIIIEKGMMDENDEITVLKREPSDSGFRSDMSSVGGAGYSPGSHCYKVQSCICNFPSEAMSTGEQSPPHTLIIPAELFSDKLSSMSTSDVCRLLEKMDQYMETRLSIYKEAIITNNIKGRVLLHCNLMELKDVMNMYFGDWEMFKILIIELRKAELDLVEILPETSSEASSDLSTFDDEPSVEIVSSSHESKKHLGILKKTNEDTESISTKKSEASESGKRVKFTTVSQDDTEKYSLAKYHETQTHFHPIVQTIPSEYDIDYDASVPQVGILKSSEPETLLLKDEEVTSPTSLVLSKYSVEELDKPEFDSSPSTRSLVSNKRSNEPGPSTVVKKVSIYEADKEDDTVIKSHSSLEVVSYSNEEQFISTVMLQPDSPHRSNMSAATSSTSLTGRLEPTSRVDVAVATDTAEEEQAQERPAPSAVSSYESYVTARSSITPSESQSSKKSDKKPKDDKP